jgi:NitT/TauT family transport system ATP-binding protein
MAIEKGSFISIIGPSGCGKTTLLRLITGLLSQTTGRILIDGLSPDQARKDRLIGYVFQRPVLFDWRTVRQNVELPGEIFGQKSIVDNSDNYLKLVGLADVADYYPHELSGGMQSRVAIARALIHKPEVLLLDEPFTDLDELNREHMNLELLTIWAETNTTMVFVTHNVQEAIFLSDIIYVLSEKPATVFDTIPIDLKRPRTIDIFNTIEFGVLLENVRRSLRSAAHLYGERPI